MTQRTAKSIALEKITKQMTSREATERVLEEVIIGYTLWKADITLMFGPDYIKGNPFEYWIINIYQPPKSETNGKT